MRVVWANQDAHNDVCLHDCREHAELDLILVTLLLQLVERLEQRAFDHISDALHLALKEGRGKRLSLFLVHWIVGLHLGDVVVQEWDTNIAFNLMFTVHVRLPAVQVVQILGFIKQDQGPAHQPEANFVRYRNFIALSHFLAHKSYICKLMWMCFNQSSYCERISEVRKKA